LTKAQEERGRLLPELQAAQDEAARLKNKYQRWSNGWLFRRLFKARFLQLGDVATEATEKQTELEEQERLSRLATEFDLPANLREQFERLCDAVAALAGSQRIWDTHICGCDGSFPRTHGGYSKHSATTRGGIARDV
jgi:hypothetical protein